MSSDVYVVNDSIPKVALYLALRGRYGQRRCPRNVGEARSFASMNPDLGIQAEELIRTRYGLGSEFLVELERRYLDLPKALKQSVSWQAAAESFVRGRSEMVLTHF